MSEGKRACVIGAGMGGLPLAIRLQAAGVATTLVEARDKPGGHAYSWQEGAFTFDAGPAAIGDPASFRELWEMTGHDMAVDLELLPVDPICRFTWPDGTHFDFIADGTALRREIARLDPADIAGFDALLAHRGALRGECGEFFQADRAPGPLAMLKEVPALARHRAWMSVHETVSRFIRHPKLREALTVHALLVGANPLTARTVHSPLLEAQGAWWPRGGMNRLAAAMQRHFERLGGETRLHDPVTAIHTIGTQASEVETLSGDVETLRDDVSTMREEVAVSLRSLDRRIVTLEGSLSEFEAAVEEMEERVRVFDDFLVGLRSLLTDVEGPPPAEPGAEGATPSPTPTERPSPTPTRAP